MDDASKSKVLSREARVCGLYLRRSEAGELDLTLQLRDRKSSEEFTYEFTMVSDLRFRGERLLLNELPVLMSEDIASRGWDSARFRVWDDEEEFIFFYCRDIRRMQPGEPLMDGAAEGGLGRLGTDP